jgi:hippurate hydrolase
MIQLNQLHQEAQALREELVAVRRRLHQCPEIGLDLPKTTAIVREELTRMGYEPHEVGPGGLSVTVGSGEKCFMLRADMDALPIEEETGLPFKATGNAMHACGHDMHATMLLGAAKLLKAHESELRGTVKLMFQPGEETLHGAKSMIEHGILENPRVDAALMVHVAAGMPFPTGCILVPGGGAFSAASDHLKLTIQGKGGHGAMPEQAVDPLLVASHLYLALQTIISREIAPSETAVISIGIIKAGKVNNVIPDTAYMEGTIRTYDPQVRAFILERIKAVTKGIAETFRATVDTNIDVGCPSTLVDGGVAKIARDSLTQVFGKAVINPADVGMSRLSGSEDFSFVSEKVPCALLMVSAGSPKEGFAYPLHHPKAIFNEDALAQGAAVYAISACGWLASQ